MPPQFLSVSLFTWTLTGVVSLWTTLLLVLLRMINARATHSEVAAKASAVQSDLDAYKALAKSERQLLSNRIDNQEGALSHIREDIRTMKLDLKSDLRDMEQRLTDAFVRSRQ